MTDLSTQSIHLPDGRTLAYAEYGAPGGKPVFYFHGLPGSRLDPVMLGSEYLAQAGLRMIATDRPGMGRSDFQPGRRFGDWPADITALADHLRLGKFAVFGISGGGAYVSACARLIPERLTAAVIASGAGLMNSPEARAGMPFIGRLMWRLAGRSDRIMALFLELTKPRSLGDPDKIRKQLERTMPPQERAFFDKPGRLEAFIASTVEATRPGVRGMAWDTHLYSSPWDFRLEEICFPVRLLHGEDDKNVPVAVARKVAASIPGCQATFYPGEGHFGVLANHLDEIMGMLAV